MSSEFPRSNPGAQAELPAAGEIDVAQLEAWMDRLVDGEVAEPERRALLSRLEQMPDGWRRCALAFLEAQAWREALDATALKATALKATTLKAAALKATEAASNGCIPASAAVQPTTHHSSLATHQVPLTTHHSPSTTKPRTSRLAWRPQPWLGMVAAAASFVIAFGLGLVVQRTWFPPHQPDGTTPGGIAHRAPAGGSTLAEAKDKWGTVRVMMHGPTGAPQPVELDAVEGPDPEQWLWAQPPAIPDHIVKALRSRGHHVQTERRYVPIPLDDGRNAVFPVDQVDVRFRGGNGYQ